MKIYVWGTGINAINFVAKCKEEIVAFIDNYKTDNFMEPWHIEIIKFDKFWKEKHKIVVATSENVYHDIRCQLMGAGLREFKDFWYHEVWDKKVAIVYGNCHTLPIKESLRSNADFSSQYGLYPMRMIHEIVTEPKDDFNEILFKNCDLFIHQSIREDNKYGFSYSSQALIIKLNCSSKIISIPNLYGLPSYYFPQTDESLAYKVIKGRYYFPFRDRFIEKMAERGCSVQYIKRAIEQEEFISQDELIEGYNIFLEKVKKRERDWDVKILNILVANHESTQLYYDVNHPTNYIFRYITQRILEKLNCSCSLGEYDLVTLLDTYEIPVYGQVREAFRMNWSNENILMRRYSKYTLSNKPISLEEYVQQYLWWINV